jgi:hypothetical protein
MTTKETETMPTLLDQRRINDTNAGLAMGETLPTTRAVLRTHVEMLWAAFGAAQSLDDQGSPEANAAAGRRELELLRRCKAAQAALDAMGDRG